MKNSQYKPTEKTYIVQELKQLNQTPLISERQRQAPVKKSLLSKAARNKIVNQNSSYQSLRGQESYGPCVPYNDNCGCSAEQLRRQVQDLENWFNREREVHQATLQRMGPLIDQRNELQGQVNILTQENGQVRQELQTERINHQQARNDLQQTNDIINNAQNILGINDLNQLPTMPQEQNLQNLVDFYNKVPQNWQQLINNRPDITVDKYNQLVQDRDNLRNERNHLEEDNEKLNQILKIHRTNAAWYDTGEADFTQGIDQEKFFKEEMPNLVYLRIIFDENYANRFVSGKDIDINSSKGLQQVNFDITARDNQGLFSKDVLADLKMKIKATLEKAPPGYNTDYYRNPLINAIPTRDSNWDFYYSLPIGMITSHSASSWYGNNNCNKYFNLVTINGDYSAYSNPNILDARSTSSAYSIYQGPFPLPKCSWVDPSKFRVSYAEVEGKVKIIYS